MGRFAGLYTPLTPDKDDKDKDHHHHHILISLSSLWGDTRWSDFGQLGRLLGPVGSNATAD
jgi:hypothetical protein